jgi:hypothetical protein
VLLPFGVYVLVAVVVERVVVTETEDGADVEAAALVEVWVSETRAPVRLYIAAH